MKQKTAENTIIPDSLYLYRSKCLQAAKDLFYNKRVHKMIREAKSVPELSTIMTWARKGAIK